jgi:serine/threonine-protein kinase
MASFPTHCDLDQLRLLLADQLPERQQSELADHLAECHSCRQTLESFAGDAGWWTAVTSCLRTNTDVAVSGMGSPSGAELSGVDDAFAADFVVDFLEPGDQPDVLGRLGEYEIVDVIGRGGMGVVLKGFQRELARFVAVKVMAPHLASSGAARQRFIREARAAAAIVHPHVMPIHSVCTTARLPYLVMPYVACESLQQRLDRRGPLEVIEILRIGLQAAQGLAASHAQGLVHRDIKPANILLEKEVDRVMLTDFGLARAVDDASLTRTGIVTGTPQYMSPEQSCGEAIDPRSDLFSLGSVLYAMCTGRPPFRAETALAVLRRITDTQARSIREVNPNIPGWLEQIVVRLHEKSPDRRFQSSSDVAELLEQCLAHVQQPTVMELPRVLSQPVVQRPRTNRRGMFIAGVGAAMLALLAGSRFVPGVWNSSKPTDSKSEQAISLTGPHWDSLADDVDALKQDFVPIEARARRPWDDAPPADPQTTSSTETLPSERKSDP